MNYSLRKMIIRIQKFLVGTRIHRKIPMLVSIYDAIYRLLGSHKSVLEIQGSKMFINIRDESYAMRKTFQSYAFNRIHEEATTELFKRIVKEGDIFIDLGANIGYFSLLASKIVGEQGKVYSFEPEPRNFKYLCTNIELNSYKNIIPVNKAVSDKTGKTKLFICSYDTGHHTINQYNGIKVQNPNKIGGKEISIEIETTTLDEFLDKKEDFVNIIKMDIEGAEMLALKGMDRIIKQSKDLKIIIEFFPLFIEKMGCSPKEFVTKLKEYYNFSIFIIGKDYNARDQELTRIDNVDLLLDFCKNPQDHLNLFIEKT